jgi:hypothetical protein
LRGRRRRRRRRRVRKLARDGRRIVVWDWRCVCVVRGFAERVVGRERRRELGQWPPVSK